MERGKSVSSDSRKPPALREVVAALTHNSVRAFSCSSSSQAPYPSFPPKGRKLAHSAAPPLPSKPAAPGFAGVPIFPPQQPKSIWQTQMGQEPCPTPKEGTQPHTSRYAGQFSLCQRGASSGRNTRQYSSNPDTIPKRDISAHSRIRNTTLS